MSDALARLRLARTSGVGPILYGRLIERFGTAEAALAALPEIARSGGRADPVSIPSKSEALREIDGVAALGGRMLYRGLAGYPTLLAQMADAPAVLAVLGDATKLGQRCVAMVGSRNASANGRQLAAAMAGDLARAGIVVVSGLARGIDGASHRAALLHGVTVACIAGGLDRPYPEEHAPLQDEIARHGVVMAEAPLGTTPQARHFPRRNRLIAGLSLGVVVIEAALRSGSLITARIALEENRLLFAAPGSPLDPRCRGSNGLLRDGAVLVETADDVIAALPSYSREPAPSPPPGLLCEPAPASPVPMPLVSPRVVAKVADLLGASPAAVDDLAAHCQFSPAEIRSALLDLEFAGRIEVLPGDQFALIAAPPHARNLADARRRPA